MIAPLDAPNEFGLDNKSKRWRFDAHFEAARSALSRCYSLGRLDVNLRLEGKELVGRGILDEYGPRLGR
jgi:hypothetical protein